MLQAAPFELQYREPVVGRRVFGIGLDRFLQPLRRFLRPVERAGEQLTVAIAGLPVAVLRSGRTAEVDLRFPVIPGKVVGKQEAQPMVDLRVGGLQIGKPLPVLPRLKVVPRSSRKFARQEERGRMVRRLRE